MDDPKFIHAVNSAGKKQRIPRAWLNHPVLGKPFRLTAALATEARLAGGPGEDWKVPELKDYADEHGIDRTGLTSKADLLAAINEATTQTTDPAQGSGETPATGDDEGAQ